MPTSRRRGPAASRITYAPDIATGCVADLAFGLVHRRRARLRPARPHHARAHWVTRTMGEGLGTRVWGKTMGIIGFGRIGRAFAHRARGFGMRVVYHDLRRAADQIEHGAVFHPDLKEMLPRCDFVSLHTPLNVATRHILDREKLALLPRGAIVVNSCARRTDRQIGADRAAGIGPSRAARAWTCSSRSRPSIRGSPSSTTCS